MAFVILVAIIASILFALVAHELIVPAAFTMANDIHVRQPAKRRCTVALLLCAGVFYLEAIALSGIATVRLIADDYATVWILSGAACIGAIALLRRSTPTIKAALEDSKPAGQPA